MTKSQLLILLLIIALVFYYLNEENQPKNNRSNNFKKPVKPQLSKPTSVINLPDEPITKWPSDTPIIELPSATWVDEPSIQPKPVNFGLNPPHSQVDEPFEPPKPSKPTKTPEPIKLPPNKPQLTKETLNCPSDQSTPDPKNIQPTELTSEEQTQRKTQELSDHHWLLNHKTIDYWHYEQKLTSPQYQALLLLVNPEEMNTLSYFLNLLPTNYEWLLINSEFKDSTLAKKWISHNFTLQQTQDWLKVGFKATDYALVAWIRDFKNLTPEQTLNTQDLEKLKEEFNGN